MKFTPEVIAAIQTLRDNADNDFERHRIDVLERDLTAPPQVEQIDGTHQRFNGEIYTKNHKNQYKRHYSVHRVLYSYYHGDIPDGYDIHHIDGDASHNTIENLQCLTRSEHMAIHYTENKMRDMRDARRTKHFVCEVCGAEFSSLLTGAKYCSIKCQKKAKYEREKKSIPTKCEWCGKEFLAPKRYPRRFCSISCMSKWREQEKKRAKS